MPLSLKNRLAIALASGLGSGYMPYWPGTFSVVVIAPVVYWLSTILTIGTYLLIVLLLFLIGTWSAEHAGRYYNMIDDQRIVIDEWVGFLVTLAFTPANLTNLLIGFILFRLFDIMKPSIIGWVQNNMKNSLGVMLDDLLAGIISAAILILLNALFTY